MYSHAPVSGLYLSRIVPAPLAVAVIVNYYNYNYYTISYVRKGLALVILIVMLRGTVMPRFQVRTHVGYPH